MKQFIISETPAYRLTMAVIDVPNQNLKELRLTSENINFDPDSDKTEVRTQFKEPFTVQRYFLTPEELHRIIEGLST